MEGYKRLLDEHEVLQRERETAVDALDMSAVTAFLDKVRLAGRNEELATRRETLRHIALTWADFIQDRTGTRPASEIADFVPAAEEELDQPPAYTVPPRSPRRLSPRAGSSTPAVPTLPTFWMYVGIGMMALVLILISLLLNRNLFTPAAAELAETSQPAPSPTSGVTATLPPPTATAVPILEITVVATNTPNAAGVRAYTVQQGDTLTSIASQFDVDVDLLRTANSLTTDLLQLGQTLWIPNEGVVIMQTPVTVTPALPAEVTASPVSAAGIVETVPVEGTAVPGELVVRGAQGGGTVTLRARPETTGEPITAVLPGTIATAVGRLADNSWYLLELTDSQVRGWLLGTEIGLIYPTTPETVPVIELP